MSASPQYLDGSHQTGSRRLYQTAADAGAITDSKHIANLGLQAGTQLRSTGVELDLNSIEQGIGRSHTRSQLLHCLKHLNQSGEVTIGQSEAQVTRGGALQGRRNQAIFNALGSGTMTL